MMRVLAGGPWCLVPGVWSRLLRTGDGSHMFGSEQTRGETRQSSGWCVQPASQSTRDSVQELRPVITMRNLPTTALLALALVLGLPHPGHAQFFNAIRNLFSPVTNLFNGGRFVDDGTRSPQVEFCNFDIDTAMNTQYLELESSSCCRQSKVKTTLFNTCLGKLLSTRRRRW